MRLQTRCLSPQMRPERRAKKDGAAKYMELNIPEDWVPVIQKAGYTEVKMLKDLNPNKFHQEICGLNKKHKLELNNPTIDEVKIWIDNAIKA